METEAAATTTTESGGMFGMDFMIIFSIFIGVYLLFYAIKGTGKVYENEYPKEMQGLYVSMMRKFCWIVGAGLLGLSVLEYMEYNGYIAGTGSIFSIISMVFVLVCVVLYFIIFRTKFKDYIKKDKPVKKK